MEIKIIKNEPIKKEELRQIAREMFGTLVKAVVDVEQGIMAVGGEFHADGEVLIMEQEGSKREHTWGVNLYPDEPSDAFIEFDSMINVKPAFGNRSMDVENPQIKEKIKEIIQKLVTE